MNIILINTLIYLDNAVVYFRVTHKNGYVLTSKKAYRPVDGNIPTPCVVP